MSNLDLDLDLVLRALSHPLRRRILRALVDGERSASSLAKEFKAELAGVSYHLNTVLAKECKVVDLVGSRQRRGALEKFYCLKSDLRPPASPGSTWKRGKKAKPSVEGCVLAIVLGIVDPNDICPPSSSPSSPPP